MSSFNYKNETYRTGDTIKIETENHDGDWLEIEGTLVISGQYDLVFICHDEENFQGDKPGTYAPQYILQKHAYGYHLGSLSNWSSESCYPEDWGLRKVKSKNDKVISSWNEPIHKGIKTT